MLCVWVRWLVLASCLRCRRPNQLATLRELESKVNLGRVSSLTAGGGLLRVLTSYIRQLPASPTVCDQATWQFPVQPHLTTTSRCRCGCKWLLQARSHTSSSLKSLVAEQCSSRAVASCCCRRTCGPTCVLAHSVSMQVLWCDDSLAIMTGINPDAPVGTKLAFVSGGSG